MKIIIPRVTTLRFHQEYDGGAKYVYYLSRYLAKKGIDVTIVTTKTKKTKKREIVEDGVKYNFLPLRYTGKRLIKLNVPYKLIFAWNLRRYLEKTDFDILHSSEMFAYFYLRKKKRKPVIMQCHGLEPFYGPESLSQKGLKKLYIKLFLQYPWRYCLQKSDKVASEGNFQTPSLEKLRIKREKIIPFPNGVDFNKTKRLKKEYKNKREGLRIKKEDLLILSVCQIAPDKGIDDIINAFVLLKKEIKNAKLLLIGQGVLEEMMYKLIKKYNLEKDIFHLKNIPEKDLYDYYFSSDIFVNASIQYDFIVGIQEAMACGLPIVSSAQPMLVKDGVNGYVIGMKNPKGIAKGILKIWGDKKLMKKMGKESIKFSKEYDWKNVAKAAIKEYEKLIKGKLIIK